MCPRATLGGEFGAARLHWRFAPASRASGSRAVNILCVYVNISAVLATLEEAAPATPPPGRSRARRKSPTSRLAGRCLAWHKASHAAQ